MSEEELLKYISFTEDKVVIDKEFYNNVLLNCFANAIKFKKALELVKKEKQELIKYLEDKIINLNEDIVNGRCQQNEIKRLRGYQEILDKVRGE